MSELFKYRACLGVAIFSMMIFVMSCKNDPDDGMHEQTPEVYYTCPMHPTVISARPGSCPVCNMNLVKKEKANLNGQSPSAHKYILHLTPDQEKLANIGIDTARVGLISEYTTLTGTVAYDESRISTSASRSKGRLEKLYVRNPGEFIDKGQALYELYSEQILADATDFISALTELDLNKTNREMVSGMLQSSRQKLLLWGLTEDQVNELEKSRKVSPYLTFHSEVSGYLAELYVHEGQSVEEGTALLTISDLSSVWVEAQLYAGEPELLKHTHQVKVNFDQLPGKTYHGNIVYQNPQLESNTKINLVKIVVNNPGYRLKPGMMAYVHLTRNEKRTLVIPKSALLLESMPAGKQEMKIVWVREEKGIYLRKMVKTGIENPDEIEIINGLAPGDLVVDRGAYLINSEFILKSGSAMKHEH